MGVPAVNTRPQEFSPLVGCIGPITVESRLRCHNERGIGENKPHNVGSIPATPTRTGLVDRSLQVRSLNVDDAMTAGKDRHYDQNTHRGYERGLSRLSVMPGP